MLLLRADGCLLGLALDAVDGVFAHREEEAAAPEVDVVTWTEVSGFGNPSPAKEGDAVVLVRAEGGRVALRADACLGVRDVSFLETPPVPTRLVDGDEHPLCYLVLLDRQPHFLIEPRALVRARDRARGATHGDAAMTTAPGS
jgi:hypothetical protein